MDARRRRGWTAPVRGKYKKELSVPALHQGMLLKRLFFIVAGAASALALGMGGAVAGTTGALYDMSILLSQPHPFALAGQVAPAPAPKIKAPRPTVRPAVRKASPSAKPRPPVRPAATPMTAPVVKKGGEILSEIRGGVLLHDQGPFSHNKESGIDTNLEVLFASPDYFEVIYAPLPHFGFSVNSAGDTSQVYLGLTWEWDFWGSGFFDVSIGGAYHTGETTTAKLNKKELGCSILFRESIDLGYRISGPHSVMLHLDHISNAKLCSTNEGLESIGIRYGYRF